MTWHFSDGTIAHLGGKIEGGTAFAQELRELLADGPQVPAQTIPSGGTALDPENPSQLDWFLRNEMDRPCNRWMMLRLVKAPEVEPLKIEEIEEVEGALY